MSNARGEAARAEPPRLDGHDLVSGHPLGHRRRGPDDRPRGPRHLHEPRGRVAHRMGRPPRPTGSRWKTSSASSTRRPASRRAAGQEGHRDGPRPRHGQPHAAHRQGRDRAAHRRQCRPGPRRGRGPHRRRHGLPGHQRAEAEQSERSGTPSPTPRASSTPSGTRSSSSMPNSASGRRAARSTRPSGSDPEETEGRLVYELGNGQWDIPRAPDAPRRHPPREQLVPRLRGRARLRGHRPTADAPQRPQGPSARQSTRNSSSSPSRTSPRPGGRGSTSPTTASDTGSSSRGPRASPSSRSTPRASITSWNAGAEEMLGYSEAEILGQNFRIIFTPEDLEARQADQEMRTAAAEGRALDERWHLRKGGEPFWAQGLVMPLKDDADEMRGFLKIIRDKTEERQLEDALKKRTAELEEADLHKNEFLAMLAHELRNPLAAIRNAVDARGPLGHEGGPRMEPGRHRPAGQELRPPHRRPAGRLPHHRGQDPAPQGSSSTPPRPPPRRRGREAARRGAEARAAALVHVRPT